MNKRIENYVLQEVIGSGQYGNVHKAFDARNNMYVAIKVVPIQKFKEFDRLEEFTMNEIQILSQINSPNVIRFYELLKTNRNYYFVYEYCNGGNLEEFMISKKFLLEDEALMIFRQVLNAFRALSSLNILHRDLKPGNILIHNGVFKLADFGFCKLLANPRELAKTIVGSPLYMAPEILFGLEYNSSAEVWSLGCLLYEMLFGCCPFEESSLSILIEKLHNSEINYSQRKLSKKTEDLLKKMLTKDVKTRIKWSELFEYVQEPLQIKNTEEKPFIESKTQGHRLFKYISNERYKFYFLYEVLAHIIEYDFSEETPISACFLMKYIYSVGKKLKANLLDSFNPESFQQIKLLNEDWSDFSETFEFKSFCNYFLKEFEMMETHYKEFLEEAIIYSQTTMNIKTDFKEEIEKKEINTNIFTKYFVNYVELIKNKFAKEFFDATSENAKKWLLHINEILDSLILDEFFLNFIEIHIAYENQKYFKMLELNQKEELYNMITNKIDYVKHKFKI